MANKIHFEYSSKYLAVFDPIAILKIYVLSESKQFLIKNWVLLRKITIHTILFKRKFRSDLKQSFQNMATGSKTDTSWNAQSVCILFATDSSQSRPIQK